MKSSSSHDRRYAIGFGAFAVASLLISTFVSACSDDGASDPELEAPSSPDEDASSDSSPSEVSDSGSSSFSDASDASGDEGGEGGTLPEKDIPTEARLKVAFIGDTASAAGFKSVINLVKREGAQLVLVQGDLTYSGEKASDWFPTADGLAGAKIPYFAARGNHDTDWGNLSKGLKSRMTTNGVMATGDIATGNYSFEYKGLQIVMANADETNPTRADYIQNTLANDRHIWKICSWHKNQRATNVGPKSDEMGWAIYENCRNAGAIVAQGHSHTYSRSKTISNDTNQTVDPTCAEPHSLCVGPGKHFFFDSSLGGHDSRPLDKKVSAKPYWATTYGGSFGALFIEFNVDGDPAKARGYFKTVQNVVIDPPASSGLSTFTITRTN